MHLHTSHLGTTMHSTRHDISFTEVNIDSEGHPGLFSRAFIWLIKHMDSMLQGRIVTQRLISELIHQNHAGDTMTITGKVATFTVKVLLVFVIILRIIIFVPILLSIFIMGMGIPILVSIYFFAIDLFHFPTFIVLLVQWIISTFSHFILIFT